MLTAELDVESGRLEIVGECAVPGGPEMLALDPLRRFLFAGCHPRYYPKDVDYRGNHLFSLKIDWTTGGLEPAGKLTLDQSPVFLETDRAGRFLLAAFYAAGGAAVYPVGGDGALGEAAQWFPSGRGAHAIMLDPSGRFAFLPHIAPSAKNAARWPARNDPEHILPNAANTILQFRFDPEEGRLIPNAPFGIAEEHGGGPRHLCFHPSKHIAYFSCEQGSAVAVYSFDPNQGVLAPLQYVSTLPEGYAGMNTCSSLRVTHDGSFLFVLNRGYDSVAGFRIDPGAGLLMPNGIFPSQAIPREMEISLDDKYLFTAGYKKGIVETYRITKQGALERVNTLPVGDSPMWILHARNRGS